MKPNFNQMAVNLLKRRDYSQEVALANLLSDMYEAGYQYGLNYGWAEQQERSMIPSTGRTKYVEKDVMEQEEFYNDFNYGGTSD